MLLSALLLSSASCWKLRCFQAPIVEVRLCFRASYGFAFLDLPNSVQWNSKVFLSVCQPDHAKMNIAFVGNAGHFDNEINFRLLRGLGRLEFRQPRASGGCSVFPFSFSLFGLLYQAPPIEQKLLISMPSGFDCRSQNTRVVRSKFCTCGFCTEKFAPLDARQVSCIPYSASTVMTPVFFRQLPQHSPNRALNYYIRHLSWNKDSSFVVPLEWNAEFVFPRLVFKTAIAGYPTTSRSP